MQLRQSQVWSGGTAWRCAGRLPQQGCSGANAHEGFKQAWFPQELIRKRPEDGFIPTRPE
jgi:hypothetical protein